MDIYSFLRLMHFLGFILLGGGLLAVFVSEWRAYRTDKVELFAEAAFYTATFYDALVTPGAALMILSGPLLIQQLGLGWFDHPWLAGMWGLFLFEFIEGNTVTRRQFRRTLRLSRMMAAEEAFSEQRRNEARTRLGQIAHFLDLPLFTAIIYFGVMRPDEWRQVIVAIAVAILAALSLTFSAPRLARRRAAQT
jgi:uncharacterized membrane protein